MDAELLDQMRESMVGRADAVSAQAAQEGLDPIEAAQPSPYDKLSDNIDDPFGELTLAVAVPTPASAPDAVETAASAMMDAVDTAREAADAHCEPEDDQPDGSAIDVEGVVLSTQIAAAAEGPASMQDATQDMAQSMADRMTDRMLDDARETLDALASDNTNTISQLEDGLDTWDHDTLMDHVDIAPTGNVNVLLTDEDPALSLDIFD